MIRVQDKLDKVGIHAYYEITQFKLNDKLWF
jgi:hypothetical protein